MKTTFQNGTVVEAEWLNEVNVAVFDAIGDGTNAPTTAAEVKTNLGIPGTIGDVTGPASSTDNAIVLFDGLTGKTIKDSAVLLSSKADSGANSDITSLSGLTTPLSLAQGGTGAALADPGADRLVFWDNSNSEIGFADLGNYLSISGTTLSNTGVGNVAVRVYTSSTTWNKPSGLVGVIVEVVGGGGGSGGIASTAGGQASASAGGGAGGYSRKYISAANLASSETVTVGTGGTAGTATPSSGGTGGTSG